MFINTGLIYSSLKYLDSNFDLMASLSKGIYESLVLDKFTSLNPMIVKEDYELIDELIYLVSDRYRLELKNIDSLTDSLRSYRLIEELSDETVLYLVSNCKTQSTVNSAVNLGWLNHRFELMKSLLCIGVKLDIDKALEIACYTNNVNIARLSINHGADVTERRINRLLRIASEFQSYNMCKLLTDIICESEWWIKHANN